MSSIKIMQLNCLRGALCWPIWALMQAEQPDILCFQEVASYPSGDSDYFDFHQNTMQRFPEYEYHFTPKVTFTFDGNPAAEGLLLASRKPLVDFHTIMLEGGYPFARPNTPLARFCYPIQFARVDGTDLWIAQNHGLIDGVNSADKRGTPRTDAHMQAIIDHANTLGGRIVFCGDLNVDGDSTTIRLAERHWTNHTAKNNITCTRPPSCDLPPHTCDYIFTNQGVNVTRFRMATEPHEVCSDHYALFATVDV
jgi:endonuclease/exonuclease/phosphatase family metal-dependent hydrolase